MSTFLRLNAVALLFALMTGIPALSELNFYRILRLTEWEPGTLVTAGFIFNSVWIGGLSVIGYRLLRRWFGLKPVRFAAALLWIPYYFLLLRAFGALFPLADAGDLPNPASGLILLFGISVTPFWIVFLCAVGGTSADREGDR
ncbi:hypothetical protein ACFFIY_13500 [Bhargavaea ullalensis]|uniref:Transmembrane protein n=1 Tax=Bhargavaea ullalensis TaxID=1265685 RepID=A0ABV2G884_9BACL